MSRCFPFPPPGYDKKILFDAEKWLETEKQEKKHKKEKREKKDKDKKDRKEKKRDKKEKRDKKDKKRKHKKDKERSDDEQREKKDSTEKLKDNDKHRETELKNSSVENDKHREKGRDQTSTENDTVGPLYNSFKNLGSNCTQRDDTSDFKILLDSGKRTRDDSKVKVSPLVQKINLTGRSNPEVPGTVLKDKRYDDRMVYGLSKEFVARSHNNSLLSYTGGDERQVAWVPGLADKRTTEQKENGMHTNVDCKKDGYKDPNREKKSIFKGEMGWDKANVKVPDAEHLKTKEKSWNAACFDNGKPSPLLKADNKTSYLGKRKAPEMNDVILYVKESQPNKLSRFHPPSNHVSEGGRNSEPCTTPTQPISNFVEKVQNHKVSSKFSYNGSKLEAAQANTQPGSERQENHDSYDVNNNILASHLVVQNEGVASNMCYASKQFASERLQTSDGHNMDGKISLCHPVVRNGKVVDEAVTHMSSGGDVMIDDQKVSHNDLKINRLEEGKEPNASSTRPSSKKVKKNEEISAKTPHPDSKYLSQILNVPSVECPDMDDQEWLFSGDNRQSNKSTFGSSQVAESEHMWSKALRIESADITALPYVIPY